MLRPTQLRSADKAVAYFGRELGASEYYLKEKGVWHGKGAERLGLPREVSREDFVALVNNEVPGSDGDRLTARSNTTRTKLVWQLDETTQSRVQVEREVSNHRAAVDWTFSLEKDKSLYLAKTKDALFEKLVHQALIERLDAMQAEVKTRVRSQGQDCNRVTGEATYAIFIHRTTRPVNGLVDPHWHAHVLQPNVTWDPEEGRHKAVELGDLFRRKAYHEAAFHARVNELALEAGYGFRRTKHGLELSVITPEEIRIFSKRTTQIEAIARREHDTLDRMASAAVKAAAKRGEFLEYDSVYTKLRDKIGERHREGKDRAVVDGKALEADWARQLPRGRWEEITPEAARSGERIGFLDAEKAKTLAIEHVFAKRSVAREVDLIKWTLHFGAGTIGLAEAERFVREDPRPARNPDEPEMLTTREIVEEEARIVGLVRDSRGKHEALSVGAAWEVRDKALDPGQLAAVRLVLENRDLAVAVCGHFGAGKSRAVKEAAHAVKALTGLDPVVLAPTGRTAKALASDAGSKAAYTIDRLMTSPDLQETAQGRHIFCDEFSLIDNRRAEWLLTFARDRGCRLVFWGDEKQHSGVQRGDPLRKMLEARVIESAALTKIYRQTNADLLEVVQDWADKRYQDGFSKAKAFGMIQVEETESAARRALVEAMVEKLKANEPVIAIALLHRHGEAISDQLRARMKEEGILGKDEREVTWLKDADLSDAQRSDPVNYQPGQVAKFHRPADGGFKSGEAWRVERVDGGRVIACKDGKRKALPLHQAGFFQVYEAGTMRLAPGDQLLINRNNDRARVSTGDLVRVTAMDERTVTLDNGHRLNTTQGLHARMGYTVTSPSSQGHQAPACYPFLPASASGMVNARQMGVSLSRAREDLQIFTDQLELLEERAVMPEDRRSASDLLVGPVSPERQAPVPVVRDRDADLQEFAIRTQADEPTVFEQTMDKEQDQNRMSDLEKEQPSQEIQTPYATELWDRVLEHCPNPTPEQRRKMEVSINQEAHEHLQRQQREADRLRQMEGPTQNRGVEREGPSYGRGY
jgi:conjugative relaxase-like TrwC/TraI family protein